MNVTTDARGLRWNEDAKNMVRKHYPLGDKKSLAKELGVSLKAIKHMAAKLGVRSQKDTRFYKLKPLYEDSVLSYYWMGFIMADGHISKRGQLSIRLSAKDRSHLEKLTHLLKINIRDHKLWCDLSNNIRDYSDMTCQDSVYGKKLMAKFNLTGEPKTTNPPASLNFSHPKYLLSFLLGFIDGDGCMEIDTRGRVTSIKLEMHGTWKSILESLCKQLAAINIGNTSVNVNKRGYAFMRIHKYKNFRYLKRFAMHHKLPILERKWNRVDENNQIGKTHSYDLPLDCDNFHD